MATKSLTTAQTRPKPAEAPNAFIGRTSAPSDAELAGALGASMAVWEALVSGLAARHGVTTREWRSYSPKAGWALRVSRGRRTIVWLSPCDGRFHAGFILGDKALLAAKEMPLAARFRKALEEAVRYPEGNGVRLTVAKAADLPGLEKLAIAKIEN
jgi:hypothetical protein